MSNDANLLVGRRPLNSNDNLTAISGANSMTGSGFGGGIAAVNYTDIGGQNTKNLANYNINFKSSETIYTTEYSIVIKPHEFNYSLNHTLRCFPGTGTRTMPTSSDRRDDKSILNNPWICPEFTCSEFNPYITTINLYNSYDVHDPVIVAKLPKPLKVSKRTSLTLKIKLDT